MPCPRSAKRMWLSRFAMPTPRRWCGKPRTNVADTSSCRYGSDLTFHVEHQTPRLARAFVFRRRTRSDSYNGGMHVTRLDLRHLRRFREATLAPGPGLNLITGDNGAGKTS